MHSSDAARAGSQVAILTGTGGTPLVGTNSPQSVAHGLAGTPTRITPVCLLAGVASNVSADGTNITLTVPNLIPYTIFVGL